MASIPLQQTTNLKNKAHPNFSRWVSLDFLIDEEAMGRFVTELQPFELLSSTPLDLENPFYLEKSLFLETYSYYISQLKQGKTPDFNHFKAYFHLFITQSLEHIYRLEVAENREILKVFTPTILVKPICLQYSKMDQSLRIGPLNPQGILWGLELSFPQLIQQPGSPEIEQVNPKSNPNALLFKKMRSWIRTHTSPTTFTVEGKDLSHPIRLGKNCLSWINKHPHLQKDISVKLP